MTLGPPPADSPLVVDASVVVKWYVPAADSPAAVRIGFSGRRLLAPDLLVPEVGNVLWRYVEQAGLPRVEGEEIVRELVEWEPVRLLRSSLFVRAAMEIAATYHRTVYDSLYLAVAVYEDTAMVTADRRLANSLAATPLARHVRLLSTF